MRLIRRHHNGDAIVACIGFEMASEWKPTPENYLGRVSKDRILEAVREGASPKAADNIAGLTKQAMAEAAAQRLKGKGWLPPVLRVPLPETEAEQDSGAATGPTAPSPFPYAW